MLSSQVFPKKYQDLLRSSSGSSSSSNGSSGSINNDEYAETSAGEKDEEFRDSRPKYS